MLTGLSRKEVLRLRRLETPHDREAMAKYNRAVRVISGWRRDPRFSKKHGKPLDLTFDKGDASFAELVKAYSGDIPARAMLDELLRTKSVEKLDNGSIRLLTESYVPHEEDDVRISILGSDVAHLLSTIDHNLYSDKGAPRFQRKVSYDNIPEEILEEFKKISARKSQHLLEELDRWLAERDRDLNPEVTGTGRKRVGLGIFYFEDDFENETTVNNDSGEKK